MNNSWSDIEVELVVADYFSMLIDELNRVNFNKAWHRKNLIPLLNNRSDGSVEFKHQNISAVLAAMGLPSIGGYKSRSNFQKELIVAVQKYLINNPHVETLFSNFADLDVKSKIVESFDNWLVSPPDTSERVSKEYIRKPIKINFLEREQNNRSLGLEGEKLALNYEKYILLNSGKHNLADQVEWVSQEKGDGLGFDILSKNLNGTDKYIEVKTTKLGKDTPFFFSSNEYLFSKENKHNFYVYRIFDFSLDPKIFMLHGSFDSFCQIEPIGYRGAFVKK